MDAKRAMSWLLFCSLLLSVLIPAPAQAAPPVQDKPPAVVSSGEDDFGMMHVALGAAGPASPGATVQLSFSAASREAADLLAIRWALPDGGELLGGSESESTGPVSAGQIVQSVRQVRFPEPGIYRVMAEGAVSPGPERRYAAVGTLYFTVGDQPAIDLIDPAAVNPNHSTLTDEVTITQENVEAADGDEAHDPCVTVRGTVRRREMRPTAAGLVDMGLVPVANAVVMMREEDTLFDDQYGEVSTGANGSYSFSFCDDDGVFDDELEIYVRLRAELKSGSRTVVEVEDSSYIDEVYEFDSNVIDTEGGSYTINWDLEGERAQIFNIADAAFQAWSFWNESGGDSNGDAIFDEAAEIHFEPGYGDTGSYYSSTWGEITVADIG